MEMFKNAQSCLSQLEFPQKRQTWSCSFPPGHQRAWSLPSRRACEDICAPFLAEAERTSSLCLPYLTALRLLSKPHYRGNLGLPQSYPKNNTVVSLRALKVFLPWPELNEPWEFYNPLGRDQGPTTPMSGCTWGRVGIPLVLSSQHWHLGLGAAELQLPGERCRGLPSAIFFIETRHMGEENTIFSTPDVSRAPGEEIGKR